jgi:hypothetical protein
VTQFEELLAWAHDTWTDTPAHSVNLAAVLGDVAKQERAAAEGRDWRAEEYTTELANLILTALRMIDQSGVLVDEAIERAKHRQEEYATWMRSHQ